MTDTDILECVIMASLKKNAREMPINKSEFIGLTLRDYNVIYNKCAVSHTLDKMIRQGAIEERFDEIMIG